MELIWLVLALLVVDLAAILFAVDTRPGFEHSPRPWAWPGAHARSVGGAPRSGGGSGSPLARRSVGG
jgi:hypothetical protein